MKTLYIASKDLLRSFRSVSFLAFGLLVPLLVSGLFYFAFGGLVSEGGGFDLPTTKVLLVNLDTPQPEYGAFSAGQVLVEMMRSEELASLLEVALVEDAAGARAAVDRQEAGVAVIVPADFTSAVLDPEGHAAIEVYQDPTLTLGPGIVRTLIRQVADGFAGSRIAVGVTEGMLTAQGLPVDTARLQEVAMQYARWAEALGQGEQSGEAPLLELRAPGRSQEQTTDLRTSIISMIMAGMLVFYVFFTAASSAASILREEESGTLARLFTTPTPQSAILGGSFIAIFVTLVVQVAVLLATSRLAFGIDWGEPPWVALVALGMIVAAAGLGILLTSLLKNVRQTGVIYGGVLTVAGMVGMMGIFTATVPAATRGPFTILSLLVPHGWAVRGWELLLRGGGSGDLLITVAVMLGLGVGCFILGALRFRKRFA